MMRSWLPSPKKYVFYLSYVSVHSFKEKTIGKNLYFNLYLILNFFYFFKVNSAEVMDLSPCLQDYLNYASKINKGEFDGNGSTGKCDS